MEDAGRRARSSGLSWKRSDVIHGGPVGQNGPAGPGRQGCFSACDSLAVAHAAASSVLSRVASGGGGSLPWAPSGQGPCVVECGAAARVAARGTQTGRTRADGGASRSVTRSGDVAAFGSGRGLVSASSPPRPRPVSPGCQRAFVPGSSSEHVLPRPPRALCVAFTWTTPVSTKPACPSQSSPRPPALCGLSPGALQCRF